VSKIPFDVRQAAENVVLGIAAEGGSFIHIGEKIFILLRGRRVEVSPEFGNHAYAALQIKYSGKGTAEFVGKAICQRVAVQGSEQASNIRLAKFSALSKDKARLYLPTDDGSLLQITCDGVKPIPNGDNPDSVWLEHPRNDAFKFIPDCNVAQELARFEQLCVKSQSCSESHSWFVAMHEGLLPYIRDFVKARMLVEHLGPSQQGKTSGAQRFTKLHGLGEVLGDVTAAYFRNSCDSLGLAVLDNKEHDDQTREMIQLLLFAATGAQNGRSMQDGSAREMKDRPVVALTSIEGVFKRELQKRVLYIPYGVRLNDNHSDRDHIEDQIAEHRNKLGTALCHVLKRFIGQNCEQVTNRLKALQATPFPEFGSYMQVMGRLLFAYEQEAGLRRGWAEPIINNWFQTFGNVTEPEGDEFEAHVDSLIKLCEAVRDKSCQLDLPPQQRILLDCFERHEDYRYGEETGTLYITSASKLLNAMAMNRIGNNSVPKTAQAVGRRLEQAKWATLKVLKASDDARLKRRSNERVIGIFQPKEPEYADLSGANPGLAKLPAANSVSRDLVLQ
jgi:hypothetical protein